MVDRPTGEELVSAVREWLDAEVRPSLTGRLAFHARVAANALGMVERELSARSDGQLPPRELAHGVADLLGREANGDPDEMLAAALRHGEITATTAATRELVRDCVRARLEIANPSYLANDPE